MSEQNGSKPRTRRQRNYSDAEKAAALTVLDFCKGNQLEASKRLGIPRKTLALWASGRIPDGVAETRQEKKVDLANLLETVIVASLEQKRGNPSCISGIETAAFVDKLLLLRGEPNSITQSTVAAPQQRGRRILELVKKAKIG